MVRPEFFYLLIYKSPHCNFPESRKKNFFLFHLFFLFYLPTLNIICLVEKNNNFFRFCQCIFENVTV